MKLHLDRTTLFACLGALAMLFVPASAHAQEYAPAVNDDFPTEVFWGDTHVHSSFSMDANSAGNTLLSPRAAYRFAKGERVVANSGMLAQLAQPLDFLLVSDHSEYMGLLPALRAGDPRVLADPAAAKLYEGLQGGAEGGMATIGVLIGSLMKNEPLVDNADFKSGIWNEITRLADEANEPATGPSRASPGMDMTAVLRRGAENRERSLNFLSAHSCFSLSPYSLLTAS